MNRSALKVRRVGDHQLPVPAQATPGAAGFDLCSTIDLQVFPGQRVVIPTGFAWEIPDEFAGQIWPRSGLAAKHGIDTLAGLIDPDYRGEIGVVLINLGSDIFTIKRGDRIGQMVLTLFVRGELREVASLGDSQRGEGGFGSTGVA